jgi:hypothetical protein
VDGFDGGLIDSDVMIYKTLLTVAPRPVGQVGLRLHRVPKRSAYAEAAMGECRMNEWERDYLVTVTLMLTQVI